MADYFMPHTFERTVLARLIAVRNVISHVHMRRSSFFFFFSSDDPDQWLSLKRPLICGLLMRPSSCSWQQELNKSSIKMVYWKLLLFNVGGFLLFSGCCHDSFSRGWLILSCHAISWRLYGKSPPWLCSFLISTSSRDGPRPGLERNVKEKKVAEREVI